MLHPRQHRRPKPVDGLAASADLFGRLFGDKGYISRELFGRLFARGVKLITRIKSNMRNCLMPLLDKHLATVPADVKFEGGQMKHLIKTAFNDVLPVELLERRDKMGFPVPLHLWARGPARDFFHDILLSPTARTRGLLNPRTITQLMRKESAFGRRLWGLLSLELWLREFIDGARPRLIPTERAASASAPA